MPEPCVCSLFSVPTCFLPTRAAALFANLKQTEIGGKKGGGGGMLRKSFTKMGRMFNKKGGAKPTLTHTAPEAYSRGAGGVITDGKGVRGNGSGAGAGLGGGELSEEAIYGRRASSPGIMANRAQSDGMILKNNYGRR